ncbi:MAG: hypothetical protein KF768_00035 [Phycisphaeraceae bacterium]|nr:hypothetical protein [Phycisphaeraceae bacterium]
MTADDDRGSGHGLDDFEIYPKPRRASKLRERRTAGTTERREALRRLSLFINEHPGYLPVAWISHQTGVTRDAVRRAIERSLVRTARFTFKDGAGLVLVNMNDAAEIGARRGRVARTDLQVIQARLGTASSVAGKGGIGDKSPPPGSPRNASKGRGLGQGGSRTRTSETGEKPAPKRSSRSRPRRDRPK